MPPLSLSDRRSPGASTDGTLPIAHDGKSDRLMETFNFILYLMAVLTCLTCTILLGRSYLYTGVRLLLWSTLCFVGLTINNVLLFFDVMVWPTETDLRLWRFSAALVGLLFLLYGFIWESEDKP